MQWSKTKKQFESFLAPSLRGRMQAHVTEYTKSSFDIGRGWLTLDGEEVISVQIPSFYDNDFQFSTETMDFGEAARAYLNMPIEEAMESDDALIRGFAFLDKRCGKRKLREVDVSKLHKFAQLTFSLRCKAEGVEC